jgi:hypothetical protein
MDFFPVNKLVTMMNTSLKTMKIFSVVMIISAQFIVKKARKISDCSIYCRLEIGQ